MEIKKNSNYGYYGDYDHYEQFGISDNSDECKTSKIVSTNDMTGNYNYKNGGRDDSQSGSVNTSVAALASMHQMQNDDEVDNGYSGCSVNNDNTNINENKDNTSFKSNNYDNFINLRMVMQGIHFISHTHIYIHNHQCMTTNRCDNK